VPSSNSPPPAVRVPGESQGERWRALGLEPVGLFGEHCRALGGALRVAESEFGVVSSGRGYPRALVTPVSPPATRGPSATPFTPRQAGASGLLRATVALATSRGMAWEPFQVLVHGLTGVPSSNSPAGESQGERWRALGLEPVGLLGGAFGSLVELLWARGSALRFMPPVAGWAGVLFGMELSKGAGGARGLQPGVGVVRREGPVWPETGGVGRGGGCASGGGAGGGGAARGGGSGGGLRGSGRLRRR